MFHSPITVGQSVPGSEMSHSKLFVSSCTRREWSRRRSGSRRTAGAVGLGHPMLLALVFVLVCGGAFLAGRGGI